MMKFTTFIEKGRIKYEQPVSEAGMPIFPQQIWRDAKLIPRTCPKFQMHQYLDADNDTYSEGFITINNGVDVYHLLERYELAPLKRVEGTLNAYGSEFLKDIILPVFDTTLNSYDFFIYLDDGTNVKPISYGVGNPIINSMAGTITFEDKEFVERIKDLKVRMTFVRYAGRKGMFGDSDCFDLPIRDDLKLLKSAGDNSSTASFEVQGGKKKHSVYILPPIDKGYHKNDNMKKNVLLTQENLNDTLHQIGYVDGGLFITDDKTDLTLKNGKYKLRSDK